MFLVGRFYNNIFGWAFYAMHCSKPIIWPNCLLLNRSKMNFSRLFTFYLILQNFSVTVNDNTVLSKTNSKLCNRHSFSNIHKNFNKKILKFKGELKEIISFKDYHNLLFNIEIIHSKIHRPKKTYFFVEIFVKSREKVTNTRF